MESTSIKKVIGNSIIYTASGLLLKCFSFFLLPLYTTYLTTEDYGITSIASSFSTTMSFVVAFSLFSAIMRFYVDLKNDPTKLKRFYGTISIFVFCSGLLWMGIFILCRDFISEKIFSGIDFFPVVFVCGLSLIFHCEQNIYGNILRSQQKAFKASLLNILYFLVTVGLNIFFVVGLKKGALGVLLATLIAEVGYTIFFVIDMLKNKAITFCFDLELLKSALKYSLPIMPHNLSTQISMLISKVLIGGTSSLASLGVYTVATQFGNMADTVQVYVDHAYGPWLYENLKNKEAGYKKKIRQNVNMLCSVIGLFFIALSLFAQDYILLFVDREYAGAWRYVPMIVTVFAIKTIYYFYVEILFYYKKASRLLFIATLSSSLLNIFISYFLIPRYGVYGSIFADAISMLVRVSIIVIISKQFEDIGLKISDFIFNFIVVVLFCFGGHALSFFAFEDKFSLINLGFKAIVISGYAIYVIFKFKKEIKGYLKGFRRKG